MNTVKLQRWIPSALVGLVLAGAVGTAFADVTVSTFDSDLTALGGASTWNPNGDSPHPGLCVWTNSGSPGGSMYVVIDWAINNGWQDTKVQLDMNPWPGYDLRQYQYLEMDVKIVTGLSQPTVNGNYGALQLVAQGWQGAGDNDGTLSGYNQLGYVTLAATDGWQHVKVSLGSFAHYLNRLTLNFNVNMNQTSAIQIHYLIDNVMLTSPPSPPPTLAAPVPGTPAGLTFIPGASTANEFQRAMVYPGPLGSAFGWFGVATPSTPVSYSFTVLDFPNVNDYSANLFLIPNGEMQFTPNDTSVDWNCTNSLILNFTANTNNPATNWFVNISTKTNLHSGNVNLQLVGFNYPELPNGTWTLTFNNNTDFTLSAPNGFTTNASLPADVADLVSGNAHGNLALTPFFGVMPRVPANKGIPSVFSRIQITGVPVPVDDTFSLGHLDTNTWSKLTDYQPDILVTSGVKYYISWNVPNDTGFQSLVAAANVNGSYKDLVTSPNWLLINGNRQAIVTESDLQAAIGSDTSKAFFMLVKRAFSKLQILLPGETAAPGTPAGKTGTPTAQTLGLPFDVVVNAVDDGWHQIPTAPGDQITLSSTDPGFGWPNTFAVNLVAGTITFDAVNLPVTFGTQGTWTITATDATDGTKTADTSAAVNANP